MNLPAERCALVMTFDREAVRIPVLALGKGWLAVDKPAGMSVHNEPGRDLCSFASAFLRGNSAACGRASFDPAFGVHPVHRLDRETSGMILLAVTREAFRFLANQFESRRVEKRYVALLHGPLDCPEGDGARGEWTWPLTKNAGGRDNPEGAGPLLESRTLYHVLDRSAHYTMAEIEPLTGRTHQIRRHAKLAGHPVVGDARYGSNRAISFLRKNCAFDRLALHARTLILQLPAEREPATLETLDIPGEMRRLFENDRTGRV